MISKTEAMNRMIAGQGHECFEHSEQGWFDITAMREWAEKNLEPILVEVSQVAPFAAESRVWDEERVNNLDWADCLTDPAMFVLYEDPAAPGGFEHLFIDGTHRAIRLQREGVKHMFIYMVPEANIIRPDMDALYRHPKLDWGNEVISPDGKIVKRGQQ